LEPLVTAFAAALLGGWADKSQRVGAMLRERYGTVTILSALALTAAANSLVAAYAGMALRREVTAGAAALLLAVALGFAGVAGLIGEAPKPPKPRGGGFLTSLVAFARAGWGDKTQYVVAALAAYYDTAFPVAAAAFAGTLVVVVPAAGGGDAFVRAVPMTALRILAASLFLATAAIVAVNALRLV